MENQTIINGAGGLFIIVAIVMASGLLGQENVFVCEDREIAMQCESLGKYYDLPNGKCNYFDEELNKTRYKTCKSGWIKYEPTKEVKLNISKGEKIYLVCEKTNDLIRECQVIDQNQTIYKISNQ